ncbi:hypothetical protein [Aeromicrobium sp.]|uniref:hypothetical protein n=1 Tax=Aeromicrobium sp. TaxID=1871063 RepID=UPI0028AF20EC|nr:hypothetical protein [Aeromicrobium sp.]
MTEPIDDETARGREKKLEDLAVDPRHGEKDEPGGDGEHGTETETIPGVEGPEGVPDLGVPDDPGTGGP